MKNLILIVICSFCILNASSQKAEVRVALNSGLFSFTGDNAAKSSQINLYPQSNSGYTNTPYGSRNGFCYGLSLDLKKITKHKTIYGMDFGYENLKSKISLNSIYIINGSDILIKKMSGQTFLNINSLNLNPYVGHRFYVNKFPVDVVGGFDLGYILSAKEIGSAKGDDGTKYTTNRNRETIKLDFRLRAQVATEYKKLGVYLGYSIGTVNYFGNYIGSSGGVYSNIIRFGLTYKLK